MKDVLIGLGCAILGGALTLGVGWWRLAKDMEKWW